MIKHRYAHGEDVVISFCYLYGPNPSQLPLNEPQLKELFGISKRSWDCRRRNFGKMDGKGNLYKAAKLSKKVWADFKPQGIDRHRDAALAYIEKRTGK